jgi:hypothetical protein
MTLIVGLRTADSIQLLSDTRISHPDVTQVEEIPGRLKVVVIRRDLCVAYAGSANAGIDAIRGLSGLTSTEAIDCLRQVNIDSGDAIDFIVGSTRPAPLLVKIQAGHATEVVSESWIGDAEAAAVFQHSKDHAPVPPDAVDFEPLVRSLRAFQAVIGDSAAPTVAGLHIRAASTAAGFSYLDEARAYYPSQTILSGVATPLSFGAAADGGFAYTLLVPREACVPIVAVHFFQGRLGYVYAPLEADRPERVLAVSHDALRKHVRERYGVEVQGIQFE